MKRYLNLNGISWVLDGDTDRAMGVRPLAQKMMHVMKMQNVNNLDHVWYTHRMEDGTVIKVESLFGRDRAYVYCEPKIYAPKKRIVIKKIRRFVPAICIKTKNEVWDTVRYYSYYEDGNIRVLSTPDWRGFSGEIIETPYYNTVGDKSNDGYRLFACTNQGYCDFSFWYESVDAVEFEEDNSAGPTMTFAEWNYKQDGITKTPWKNYVSPLYVWPAFMGTCTDDWFGIYMTWDLGCSGAMNTGPAAFTVYSDGDNDVKLLTATCGCYYGTWFKVGGLRTVENCDANHTDTSVEFVLEIGGPFSASASNGHSNDRVLFTEDVAANRAAGEIEWNLYNTEVLGNKGNNYSSYNYNGVDGFCSSYSNTYVTNSYVNIDYGHNFWGAYVKDDCEIEKFKNLYFVVYTEFFYEKIDSSEGTECEVYGGWDYSGNWTNLSAGNCDNVEATVSIKRVYSLVCNINGTSVLLDSYDGITNYESPFICTDSHIYDADGIPVYMYAYLKKDRYSNVEYTRYGYFYGSANKHYRSEKFYPVGNKTNGIVNQLHDVYGSEDKEYYGFGQCAGYMVEEEYKIEE